MSLRPIPALLLLLTLAWASQPEGLRAQERSGFVTRIGEDTIVVEDLWYEPGRLTVTALQRSPRLTFARYEVELDSEHRMTGYRAALWEGVRGEGEADRTESLYRTADGWNYTSRSERGLVERTVEAGADAVPFVDQLHWSFDLALRRHAARGEAEVDLPMVSGGRAMTYGIVRMDGGGWGLRHPSRGTSAIRTDAEGRLVHLDGYGTTRALIVERTDGVSIDEMGRFFASAGAVGELSGRGETVGEVAGAQIVVDYGRPLKRNREIFGKLVAYGRVWRTGANQATHITTDRTLVLGGELEVPAGTYTLFSIPEEDHLTLIVNTRTNINGQSYDEEANLGMVRMRRDALGETVEPFTIGVREAAGGGVLELLWDRTAYRVDFQVR